MSEHGFYRWANPTKWLLDKIQTTSDVIELRGIALALARSSPMDNDEIQVIFQSDMDEDGYFNPKAKSWVGRELMSFFAINHEEYMVITGDNIEALSLLNDLPDLRVRYKTLIAIIGTRPGTHRSPLSDVKDLYGFEGPFYLLQQEPLQAKLYPLILDYTLIHDYIPWEGAPSGKEVDDTATIDGQGPEVAMIVDVTSSPP